MAQNNAVVKILEKVGKVGPRPAFLRAFKEEFLKTTKAEFSSRFMDAVMSLIVADFPVHCSSVNNMIKFAAHGMATISECRSVDGHTGLYVIAHFFRECRICGTNNNKVIRWRFCLFVSHLLEYMSEGAVLSEELCDVATAMLLQRLKDKKPEIRALAAQALHRLQVPDNAGCKIVQQFLFHMTCDPSVEVRTTIVKKITMIPHVVDEMLKHTLTDMSNSIRKEAYGRLLTYPFQSFSPKQRIMVLEKGFIDPNENFALLVKKRLLDVWLQECGNNFVVFLENLGVENDSICEKVLRFMFEDYYDVQILILINDILNVETRTIDFSELTVEKIFLWKCVAKYLTKEKKIELVSNQGHSDDNFVDVLLPNLVSFTEYVSQYYFYFQTENDDKAFILTQLLDMASTFERDDFGAETLNKLCFDLILDSGTSVKHMKPIAVLFNLTFINGQDILNYVKEILNEIQNRTIDIYPSINKVGKKKSLDHQKENELTDSTRAGSLMHKCNMIEDECEELNTLPEELGQVDVAEKILLKGFELIFQVQQLIKVSYHYSLLTDIVQNFVVRFLECLKINLRMAAIRSLAPYMLNNNVAAAKEHLITLCAEIANPLGNRHLVLEIMFELFLRYNVNTFGMNDDLDIKEGEENKNVFSTANVLTILANCFDYEVEDSSFKSVVVKSFCDLLIFKKIKSINIMSKLVILWFRRTSYESYDIHTILTKYFTTFVFFFRSSSSILAKCYVQILKEIHKNDLTTSLGFKIDQLNSTLLDLIEGLMFNNANAAVNAHSELAGYILDYLLEEQNPYSLMLINTLSKLEIDFNGHNDLTNSFGLKLSCVIKHFKNKDCDRIQKSLKKLATKFDLVIQKINQNVQITVEEPQVSLSNLQDSTEQISSDLSQDPPQASNNHTEVQSDLFTMEHDLTLFSSSDEEEDNKASYPQLEAVKRMSELLKKSFSMNCQESDDEDVKLDMSIDI